jgi:hypothetical protein
MVDMILPCSKVYSIGIATMLNVKSSEIKEANE